MKVAKARKIAEANIITNVELRVADNMDRNPIFQLTIYDGPSMVHIVIET